MRLSTKIALSFILLVALTIAVLLGVLEFERQRLRSSLSTELKEQIKIQTSEVLKPIYKLCEVKEAQTIPLLQKDLNIASFSLMRRGGMSLAKDLVPWRIANRESRVVELPMMLIGEGWLGQNADPNTPSPIVDEIQKIGGVHCSIYQRVNTDGDMIDVCTSEQSADGHRAIGTMVSHLNKDGSPNQLIQDILVGRQYSERASYANDWTSLMCEPIVDGRTKQTIGALCVSLSQKNTVESIRKIMLKTVIGKSGYMWVLGSKGERRGVYIISKDGRRDGENLWNFQDENGDYFVRFIVKRALQTEGGNPVFYRYPWKNPGDIHPRMKIAAFTYFEPWDWIIGASAYEDDFQEPQIRVDATLSQMFYLTLLTGLALILCSILVGYLVRKTIRRFTEERERQNWLKTGLNELSGKMRGEQEVGQLTHAILESLAESLDIQAGVIYLRQDPDRLFPIATYGVSDPEKTIPIIAVGEGIAGQSALKKETVFIKEVRKQPEAITAEFGGLLRGSIIANPLIHENEAMGVIQLASSVPLYDIHRTFMEHAAEAITIAIITARSRSEVNELLKKTQKQTQDLERISRFKSDFLANMSHELRTPLNAILGFSELMTRDATLSAEQLNNLNIINRSGEHLLSLINNVLELSKIEAGKPDVQREDFDLHNVILGLEEMFRLRADQKGLRLDFEMATDVPQYIRTDQGKLRQILINLLGNAVKFSDKGAVTLRIKRSPSGHPARQEQQAMKIARQSDIESCTLIIDVIDMGMGIAENELDKVFNPFFQSATGQAKQGTGLGLSISRGFALAMGGDLCVKSELGAGSTFTLTVPVEIIDGAAFNVRRSASRIIGLEPDQPCFRIMVAEDNPASRNLLVTLLQTVGFEARGAVDGLQAMELSEEWKPHLIWMDIKMPVIEGVEATRIIKNSATGKDIKVIALTASAFEEDRMRFLAQGFDDFLRKPFREAEVFEMLNKHLGVKYIYSQTNEGVAEALQSEQKADTDLAASIKELPREMVDRLKEAVELSDVATIEDAIEYIRQRNARLADHIVRLARDFNYDEILALIQKAESKPSENVRSGDINPNAML